MPGVLRRSAPAERAPLVARCLPGMVKWSAMDAHEESGVPRPGSPGKVRIGFFSFTEVTDPSEHRSYNEWHQLDHLPEQYPIPGVAWGQRWVSTPDCRRARAVDGPRLAAIHYLTQYLMTEPVDETLVAFAALGRHLHEVGRFHQHRRSHLSGPFEVLGAAAAPRVLVSPAAVPFRPGTGVYVVVEELAEGAGLEALRATPDVASVLETPGVAGVWSFAPYAAPVAGRWRPGAHRITVCFLDGDVMAAAAALGPLGTGGAHEGLVPIFAGPFATVTPWQWDWFERDSPR